MNYPQPLSPEYITDLLLTLELFLQANQDDEKAREMLEQAKALHDKVNNDL